MDNNSAVTSRSSRRQYGDGQQYDDRRQNSRRQNENGRDTGQSIYDDDDDDDDDYIGTSPRPRTQPPETPVTPMTQNNNRNHSSRRHVDSDRSQDLASRRSRARNNDGAPKQMEITSEVLKETVIRFLLFNLKFFGILLRELKVYNHMICSAIMHRFHILYNIHSHRIGGNRKRQYYRRIV